MRYVLWAFPRSARGLSCRNRTGSIDCSETKTNTSFDSLDVNLDPCVPRNAPGSEGRICIFSFFVALSIYCWPLKAICARVLNGGRKGNAFIQHLSHEKLSPVFIPSSRHISKVSSCQKHTPCWHTIRCTHASSKNTDCFISLPDFQLKKIFSIFMHERRFYISLDKPCSHYASENEFTGILSEW